jgi:predicted metal-dependent HD superfamily phosphohydrolase
VWFHDAVYDPHAADNEERSADYATDVLGRLGVKPDGELRRLVLATSTHENPDHNPECQLLLDADLAILGAPQEEYDRYAVAIRMEYAWASEAHYARGRSGVLKGFLNRGRIYGLQPLHTRFEAQARRNLSRELASLKS